VEDQRWGQRVARVHGVKGLAIVAASIVLLAACTNSGPASAKAAACAPTGTALTITAPGFKFDKNCLAAPAGQPFTITLYNTQSGVEHNVLISQAFAPGSPILLNGAPVMGPGTTTYNVAAMSPGTYSFECSLHPGFMHGTFIVVAIAFGTSSPPVASSPQSIYTGTPSPTVTATTIPN
jgi:plastocyanin